MLTKPDISDESIAACLHRAYGLCPAAVSFLPIGNDVNSAAYQVVVANGTSYFLKLRSGAFNELTVTVPHLLWSSGDRHVIPPVATSDGSLWVALDEFMATLFPFVPGENGFAHPLDRTLWIELGIVLRQLHSTTFSQKMFNGIPRENYSTKWRDRVARIMAELGRVVPTDEVAADMVAFLVARRETIEFMVSRADDLARRLTRRRVPQVVCHADIHAGNVLIDSACSLHIVDWDTLTRAPKERDLMFVGAGIGGAWKEEWEIDAFMEGYGAADVELEALAYYRLERFIEDVAEYAERLMLHSGSDADRAPGLRKFMQAFEPGNVVDIAIRTCEGLPASLWTS